MESLSPQVVSAAKLPILNPNEFDLWKIRIEHYFLMTDYSLWEVILNGDSPIPTRVIEGVLQPIAPTTAEQRLARKNELKARGTLLMALPDKHQLKFNIHKDAKTLMEAIEKRFSRNKETKKIYKAEVKSSSSASTSTQNIAFVSSQNTNSTNKPVSVVARVSAASAKVHVFVLPNVDTLSNAVIYSFFASQSNSLQLDNDDLKQIEADDLEEIDLKCYDWSFQAEDEPTNYALMAFTSSSFSSADNELRDNALVVLKQKFEKAEQERDELKLKLEKFQTSSKNLSRLLASQTNDKTGLGYDNQVFTSSMFDCNEMFSSESDISMHASPKYDRYQSKERYHVVPPPYTGTFMPPKLDLVFHDALNVNETVHTAFNVELSPTKPDKDLSHTHRPSVKPVENSIPAANHKTTIPKTKTHGNSRNRKACFVLLTKSKLVPFTAARPVTTAVPQPYVIRPRPAKTVVTKPYSPLRRNINRRPSPKPSNFPPKVTTVKAPMVNVVKGVQGNWGNPQHALKDKGVIDSGCSRHMTGNMSYLTDFEEINGGYVAFGGNPKGGKISGKGEIKTGKLDFDDVYFVKELKFNLFSVSQMCDKKNSVLFTDTECIVLSPEFKLPNENQVLLRVPRENNMYNVDSKNIVPFGELTCIFAKATLDESNHWRRRLGHINFKTMNKV
nr:ribonuclease H-like domain-containing protein [Tanacetum cinerariifolium]